MNKILYAFMLISPLLCACHQEQEVCGTLRMGHEVRSFTNEADNKEYWLIDKSQTLMPAYQKIIGQEVPNSQPVRACLEVKNIGKPQDGFGAEYDGGYELQKIINLSPINKG